MSRSVKKPRPKCVWCGCKIKGKLRLAAKGKRGVYCRDGCGPLPGGRRGEAVRR